MDPSSPSIHNHLGTPAVNNNGNLPILKQVIQILVNEGSPRIQQLSAEEGGAVRKSDVWQRFDCLAVDGAPVDFVVCRQCRAVLAHTSRGGTSGLRNHRCQGTISRNVVNNNSNDGEDDVSSRSMSMHSPLIEDETTQSMLVALSSTVGLATTKDTKPPLNVLSGNPLVAPAKSSSLRTKEVPLELVHKVKEDCIRLIVKDLRSSDVLNGEGFHHLVQTFILIGAHFGNVDINSCLPETPDVLHHLDHVAEQIRNRLKEEMGTSPHVALSTDFWLHPGSDRWYVTISGHYYLEDGVGAGVGVLTLRGRILCTRKVDTSDSKWKAVQDSLERFGLSPSKVTLVTDDDALKALAIHTLRVLSTPLNQINRVVQQIMAADDVRGIANSVNRVCCEIKSLKLDNDLDLYLEDCLPDTSWASFYIRLKFLSDNYATLFNDNAKLAEEAATCKLPSRETLTGIVEFLQPFKDASQQLDADAEPTIHLAMPWIHQLKCLCEHCPDDCDVVVSMKQIALRLLDSTIKVGELHCMATIFNPRMKLLSFVSSPETRIRAHDALKRLVSSLPANERTDTASSPPASPSSSSGGNAPPEKKRKRFSGSLENLYDDPKTCAPEVDEVALYLNLQCGMQTKPLAAFWLEYKNHFPRLFRAMQRVLCIPASASAQDRLFRYSSQLVAQRRRHLDPESIDNALVLQTISDFL